MRRLGGLGVAGVLVAAMGCATLIGLEPADQGTGGGGATAGTGGVQSVTSTSSSSASSTSSSSAGSTSSTSSTASSSSSGVTATSSSSTSSSGTPDACVIAGGPAPAPDMNALMCPLEKCQVGLGGCMFLFSDMGPTTTIGLATNEACTAGTLTPLDSASKYYGAGIGFNLGPAVQGGSPAPVQLGGNGVTVKLSNVPTGGARLQVVEAGVTYCADIVNNPSTVPWSHFYTQCYASPPGTQLAGPPSTPFITVNILSEPNGPVHFDFCVEQLTVTTM